MIQDILIPSEDPKVTYRTASWHIIYVVEYESRQHSTKPLIIRGPYLVSPKPDGCLREYDNSMIR